MKTLLFFCYFISVSFLVAGQVNIPNDVSIGYRPAPEKINDLVHTRLDARFDYSRSQLNGKVWITLKPHFYPTDSLTLDAKAMDIKEVSLITGNKKNPLTYIYNGARLEIKLGRAFTRNQQYMVYIAYTAKPDEYTGKGSAAITDDKGLYFINPRGEEKNKPTQIWTQGETESNSVWVPTIDKPNQKTTDEILMTVPSKYVTLSNGVLVNQKDNGDGTRTDDWKMDLPHAPYLLFMGVGDYAIIKDKYKNKEVNYYVEKEYAPTARKIFGNTPEMMAFFSHITGVEYPWIKYSQIVGRDYVSGAMENTTATLHQESAQQDARELTDGNRWERDIAHELFHQWFGDLVTAESWSNITLNESFANYSEYLWNEYKYGKDAADAVNYADMMGYINSGSQKKDLVRFYYNDKEDVFDAVSYNKGGRILHMLRNYVGDSAFFKSLNVYLAKNKFKSAEAQDLRLAFEEVTGKDLNWYWNQWYYGSGHPELNITYSYDETGKRARVIVEQIQEGSKVFRLPVKIDVYSGTKPEQYYVWVNAKVDTFSFPASQKPALINFDADKVLLAKKTENKSLGEYYFQYLHAAKYLDRKEAIDAALKVQSDKTAEKIILMALDDRFAPLRTYTIKSLDISNSNIKATAEAKLYEMGQTEIDRLTKAAAIAKLNEYQSTKYISLFKAATGDSSYTVSGNALEALFNIDSSEAITEARKLSAKPSKGILAAVILKILIRFGDESSDEAVIKAFETLPLGQAKFEIIGQFATFLKKLKSIALFKRGIDGLIDFENAIPKNFRNETTPLIDGMLNDIHRTKTANGDMEAAAYIESKMKKEKKGF
ncbi:MAG TPA: M1 family metallopeptidase [Flavisolibacter sp.]|nr:M1 family metallopeptidase [Flavisolibacter sp.]